MIHVFRIRSSGLLAGVLCSAIACGARDGSSDPAPVLTPGYGRPPAPTSVAPPVLTSLHPASGSIGGGEQIDLTGTSFEVGTAPVVTFGGTPALVADSSSATSITVLTPAHGEGAVHVTVTNSDGKASTLVNGFTYRTPVAGAPTVTRVTNDATGLPSGSTIGGEAVTITGTSFAPGATVLFGASAATDLAYVSTTTLTATTPLTQPAGTVDVTVTLPGTGLAGTILHGFTFLLAAPHVTSFSVNSSPPAGGGLLLMKGLNLQASSTVTFGGIPATVTWPSFEILRIRKCPNAADPACPAGVVSPTPTSLVVTVPSSQLDPGSYGFVVTNFDGQSAMAPGVFVVP